MTDQNTAGRTRRRKTAGAFDIRNVIGALLGLYGVVLLLTAALRSGAPEGTHNSDNWWGGGALLLVGLIFIGWARLRPIVVADQTGPRRQPGQMEQPGQPGQPGQHRGQEPGER